MPPFIDQVHFHEAFHQQAIPTLEAIAANGNQRVLRRFEHDDPPPYVSSTESSDLDEADFLPPPPASPGGRAMPDELKAIMEQPITDEEIDRLSFFMADVLMPRKFYYTEAMYEKDRVDSSRGPRPPLYRGLNGIRRQGVLARHNVKRRWEQVGVWNPKWGFAGRKMQPGDDFRRWTWPWEPQLSANDDMEAVDRHRRELVARALRLRQNLARGEHVPVPPRSHLGPDATAAQAESFLISRPWFLFRLEIAEENTRYWRLSSKDKTRYNHSARGQVTKWWKERGDWGDGSNHCPTAYSWKWGHESPAPEPVDMSPMDKMKDSPLDVAADMEFTPSEVDELETIDLPESEQPEGFWVIEEGSVETRFPGELDDGAGARKKVAEIVERAKAEGREPFPASEGVKYAMEVLRKSKFYTGSGSLLFPSALPLQGEASSSEPQADAPDPENDAVGRDPTPQTQQRPRQRQPRRKADEAPEPPPRRSARIAGVKRLAEAAPAAPNKRPRRSAPPKTEALANVAAVVASAQSGTPPPPGGAPGGGAEAQSRQGRGRRRKSEAKGSAAGRSEVKKKAAARKARADGTGAGASAPPGPRRRGRPRKNGR